MALGPMSRVLTMSIRNLLMVSNSCGRTLREPSMTNTRSTGPDGHLCSGPGDGQAQLLVATETASTAACVCRQRLHKEEEAPPSDTTYRVHV